METGAAYIKLYQIGREVEAKVQDYISELVEEGILPRPHRNTPRDAVRHCTAACTLSLQVGRKDAEFMQDVSPRYHALNGHKLTRIAKV